MRTSVRLDRHELLVVTGADNVAKLWTNVGRRSPDGWLLEPLDGTGERRLFSHLEIFNLYVSGRLKCLGKPARKLDAEEEIRVRRAWDGAPAHARFAAERAYLILRACREMRHHYKSMAECFNAVPALIVAKHGPRWVEEERRLRPGIKAAEPPVPDVLAAARGEESPYWIPRERTLWNWHALCSGPEVDVRKLLPRWHLRGDSRPLFDATLVDLMDEVIEAELDRAPKKTVTFAYAIFKEKAEKLLGINPPTLNVSAGFAEGLTADAGVPSNSEIALITEPSGGVVPAGPGEHAGEGTTEETDPVRRRMGLIPSETTFWRRARKGSAAKRTRGLSGRREEKLQFGTWSEREAPPFYMHQVEVDHSFLTMNVLDDDTRRLLGRPWVTALRERTTKVVLGLHVSFLPPSWMTLSRAIGHAIWPKDLSSHPGLQHDWFCHGVFDWLVSDRGVEFLGDGLRSTGRIIGFEIGNLQGFSPWLKGGLERLFRTMKGQVFNYRDGTSAWRALKHFDGRASTTMTFSELKAALIEWVVDKYHYRSHDTIGMSPAERWGMELTSFGPPNPVAEFHDLRRLFCKPEVRGIHGFGIEYDGLIYESEALAPLRGRTHGAGAWNIMVDPFDLRSIFVEDPLAGVTEDTWIEVPCNRPELAVNVTQHQHEFHKLLARLSSPGERLTEAMLLRARAAAERRLAELGRKPRTGTAARLARYRDDGSFLTPVRLSPPPPLLVQSTVDWGPALIDPVTGRDLRAGSPNSGPEVQGEHSRLPAGAQNGATDASEDRNEHATDADYEALLLRTMEEMDS